MPSAQTNTAAAAEGSNNEPVDPVIAQEEAKKTVFVGNLPYNVTDGELKDIFSIAGTITEINLIKHFNMSLGFGFIRFSSEESAKEAVEKCNKKDVQGRPLNVEISRARQPGASRGGGYRGRFYRRGRGRYRQRRESRNAEPVREENQGEKVVNTESDNSRGRDRGRGRRRGGYSSRRGRGGRRGGGVERDDGQAFSPAAVSSEPTVPKANHVASQTPAARVDDDDTRGRGRGRGGRGRGFRRGRPGRRPRGIPEGPDSQTMLFVANLPFKVTDEDLKGIFHDYNPVSAHVVMSPWNGRSKGFGFVAVETHADQQRALDELVNVDVEDRALVIKVAKEQQVPPQTKQPYHSKEIATK